VALSDLLAALERDATDRVHAIRGDGDARAAEIREAAARERAARIASRAATFVAERRAEADRELAAAAHRARAAVLSARAAMLDRVRDAVRAELPGAAADPDVARRLADAALACAGDGPELVPTRLATGFVVELPTQVRIEATLESLFAREWPRLACEALALEREA